MAQYWGDYPVADDEGEIPEGLPTGRYVPLVANGHGALTAWAAGPGRCFRTSYPAALHPPVKVSRGHQATGDPQEVWFEAFTEEDLRAQNEDINAYLASAGVRPQPRGYKWHVLVPDNIVDEDALEDALRDKNNYVDPVEVFESIAQLYGNLFRS